MKILDAAYVGSSMALADLPAGPAPEVAFLGRSNVGKSSLLNALVMRHELARTSRTPGKTRTINSFDVRVRVGGADRQLRLCDLPGYGFAKVSHRERSEWQKLLRAYLRERAQLRAVVALIDAVVGPTDLDGDVVEELTLGGAAILVAATKIDRVPKSRRVAREIAIERLLGVPPGAVVGCSAHERLGLDRLWTALRAPLGWGEAEA